MKDSDHLSIETLNKKLKTTITGTAILAGVIVIFFILMIIDYVETKAFNSMWIIPIVSTFIVVSNILKIRALRKILKSKQS
ncbi:hypothetical protein [Gelidibacter pelagius]|uniref:Redox-active disulfide protein 2 n=1 Tax=Gelidibacter pelagius TaxID=2819985 RepID=A0ABS3SX37_9FLAO|nr:hypothetical protein [Gelidibacter pelagius]MBO3100285.1 hypothetical protein [Gelidibacter pelagius]